LDDLAKARAAAFGDRKNTISFGMDGAKMFTGPVGPSLLGSEWGNSPLNSQFKKGDQENMRRKSPKKKQY
jgi:hypothetical protein